MRGFILAAGFGTRLRPLTDHVPKALVPLAGIPLLGHALDFMEFNGIDTIGVNTHYLPEQITTYCAETDVPVRMFHETPAIRGTGGALHFARHFLGEEETFIVINVDIITRCELREQISRFLTSGDCCRLLAWTNDAGTGTIVYEPGDCRYCGTAAEVMKRDGLATADFIGMALYRREFLELLTGEDFSILPVWRRAADRGMAVSVGIIEQGYWRDIGNPLSLAQAHFDVIDGKLDLAVPESLQCDKDGRRCYPREWDKTRIERLGMCSWVEEPSFVPFASVEHTVVLKAAVACPRRSLQRSLLTPWGEIPFDA